MHKRRPLVGRPIFRGQSVIFRESKEKQEIGDVNSSSFVDIVLRTGFILDIYITTI